VAAAPRRLYPPFRERLEHGTAGSDEIIKEILAAEGNRATLREADAGAVEPVRPLPGLLRISRMQEHPLPGRSEPRGRSPRCPPPSTGGPSRSGRAVRALRELKSGSEHESPVA